MKKSADKTLLLALNILFFLLIGCDANLHLTYSVENKTKTDITLFVPNFKGYSVLSIYGKTRDTTLILNPKEEIVVGLRSKVDFPWATKTIYNKHPGICGLKQIGIDTTVEIGCTKIEWVYDGRNSKLKLK